MKLYHLGLLVYWLALISVAGRTENIKLQTEIDPQQPASEASSSVTPEVVDNRKQVDLTTATGVHVGTGFEPGGREFESVAHMWSEELYKDGSTDLYDPDKGWYGRALRFWAGEEPTINGVLGGTAAQTHAVDIRDSKRFLLSLEKKKGIKPGPGFRLRVRAVDVIEPSPKMLEVAISMLTAKNRLGRVFTTSLEKTELTADTYDFIVIQWVAMYLTDNDLVAFLKQCKQALKEADSESGRTSVIYVKENVMYGDQFLLGKQDLAINRCDSHYKAIFKLAGLELLDEADQSNWPETLVPIRMYALR